LHAPCTVLHLVELTINHLKTLTSEDISLILDLVEKLIDVCNHRINCEGNAIEGGSALATYLNCEPVTKAISFLNVTRKIENLAISFAQNVRSVETRRVCELLLTVDHKLENPDRFISFFKISELPTISHSLLKCILCSSKETLSLHVCDIINGLLCNLKLENEECHEEAVKLLWTLTRMFPTKVKFVIDQVSKNLVDEGGFRAFGVLWMRSRGISNVAKLFSQSLLSVISATQARGFRRIAGRWISTYLVSYTEYGRILTPFRENISIVELFRRKCLNSLSLSLRCSLPLL
jgi:hypothetical protein